MSAVLPEGTARPWPESPVAPPIAWGPTAMTAFVGRALKGPVSRPVVLGSFEDYQRTFGGLWQPSMLSYAVEQFFENGGQECIVVRVCNGGRAPTIRLPAGQASLTLIGLTPGTREFLRASVDYDGIGAAEPDRFNLVVQRVRGPGSEFIEEQEIYRRASVLPDADRHLTQLLAGSRLVQVHGPLPSQRPERSGGAPSATIGYVPSAADGDDGEPLSPYDIIGNAREGTGLFALRDAPPFNFLCVPPLTRDQDVGLPALLVALRLCRERQALLLMDPPVAWRDAEEALDGLRGWPLHSEDAAMFFPRVLAADRKLGRDEVFGSAASAAGMLARFDRQAPLWAPSAAGETMLRPSLRPAAAVSAEQGEQLAHAGVNVWRTVRAREPVRPGLMLPGAGARLEYRDLALRRLSLALMGSVCRGTVWATGEVTGPSLWRRLRAQVGEFLAQMAHAGAFAGTSPAEQFYVVCDERLNAQRRGVRVLFGYALVRPGEFTTCLVTHGPDGSGARVVQVNRAARLAQS